MKTAAIGFPRIGEKRELKRVTESYFKNQISKKELISESKKIREKHWKLQSNAGIDFITSNDFSFYDLFLDTTVMLNAIPKEYKDLNLSDLDTYFAMAKGYQNENSEIKALPMKKWFNTNYHYLVPKLSSETNLKLNSQKIINEYLEAKNIGIETKPVIIGPLTFLKLSKIEEGKENYALYLLKVAKIYEELISDLSKTGVKYLQIDEPILVTDIDNSDIENFNKIYSIIFENKPDLNIILQTYFGDVRDAYSDILKHPFYAVGLDFLEGYKNLDLLEKNSFPKEKLIFAGIVNGKNIWKNNYKKSADIIGRIKKVVPVENIVLNTSCSLLHVPYTLRYETKLNATYKNQLAFAEEKLNELSDLKEIFSSDNYKENPKYIENIHLIECKNKIKEFYSEDVRRKVAELTEDDFNRTSSFTERIREQNDLLNLPKLPTTTIGSFPQTADVRKIRMAYKKGEISKSEYDNFIKDKIKKIVNVQDELGLDVLVHGEYERNDMVEYFGENLSGFLFTENGWVQSYGTRGVKPPIIFGDVKREKSITVQWTKYAQSLTDKPLKGMLTGPITIQNWSFLREDLDLKTIAYQIGLAIQEEVLELEKDGIKVIQIDEAALREKLPIRQKEWKKYLDWAIKAFKLTNSKVESKTQIHTHMCYSEFDDIMQGIKDMDADVITIEAAKSDLSILDTLKNNDYDKEVGPGVYDIHSPRVPSEGEFKGLINNMIELFDTDKLWVNPDCGLKTREEFETIESLKNMVNAAKEIRENL